MGPSLLANGRYELYEFISKGGMGAIYRAMDQELGRWVALKCLHETDNASNRELALKEARTLASLNHPNILRVYDVLTVNDQIWIVSEWLEGRSLAQTKKPCNPGTSLAIITQVYSALAAAHEAQVIHRDVKPANIMLRNDGRITLIDFGVAFAPGNSTGQTIVGSLRYTDPRILEGQHPDAHSDLFSTSLVLSELLTGEPVLPDLAPLPLYRHIKKNLAFRLDSTLDGIYPPITSLVRKYTDMTRLDELQFSSPAREAALLSQDFLRKLTQASPEEYLANGICANVSEDPAAEAVMKKEAADAIASPYLSPKQKSAWVAFGHSNADHYQPREMANHKRTQAKSHFFRRAGLAAKQTQHLVRKKNTFLIVGLAVVVMALTVFWMVDSTNSKKADYQKSHALNDLINPENRTNNEQLPTPALPGIQGGVDANKNVGELDKSALLQPTTVQDSEPGPTWNIVLDQPGNLIINGREYGVVKMKEINLDYGVHVFEVRRNGKPVKQLTMALSADSPKKISVK